MPSLKEVQSRVPSAATVAGRVIAYHNGKHLDLGQYVGVDAVVLSAAGEEIMSVQDAEVVEVKPRRKMAPNQNAKSEAGLNSLKDLEV